MNVTQQALWPYTSTSLSLYRKLRLLVGTESGTAESEGEDDESDAEGDSDHEQQQLENSTPNVPAQAASG